MNYETKGAMSENHRKPAKDHDFDTFVKQFSEMKIMLAETCSTYLTFLLKVILFSR